MQLHPSYLHLLPTYQRTYLPSYLQSFAQPTPPGVENHVELTLVNGLKGSSLQDISNEALILCALPPTQVHTGVAE